MAAAPLRPGGASFHRQAVVAVGCLVSLAGCDWTRFDTFDTDAPVAIVEAPDGFPLGFGRAVAGIPRGGGSLVVATGTAGAAFDLDGKPATGATDLCDDGCAALQKPAGLLAPPAGAMAGRACFVHGITGGATPGLGVRCLGEGGSGTLPLPDSLLGPASALTAASDDAQASAAASRGDPATVAVGWGPAATAWFYRSTSPEPVVIDRPDAAGERWATDVAVVEAGGATMVAVSDPGSGVFLYDVGADGDTPALLGCLPGRGSGAVAAGPVAGQSGDDLVVSEGSDVLVLDGGVLAGLAGAASSGCGQALPDGALLGRLGCTATDDVGGCAGAAFGASLVVADLDGDGAGEVIVGAPEAVVRDEPQAGAIYSFVVDGTDDAVAAREVRFLSTAGSGDRLGASLAAVPVGAVDVVVAGVPGQSRLAVFYCSTLTPGDAAPARCP